MPDASPINAGSLLLLAAIAVAGFAAFVSQNFEPNPNARVSLGLEAASPAVFADSGQTVCLFCQKCPAGL